MLRLTGSMTAMSAYLIYSLLAYRTVQHLCAWIFKEIAVGCCKLCLGSERRQNDQMGAKVSKGVVLV